MTSRGRTITLLLLCMLCLCACRGADSAEKRVYVLRETAAPTVMPEAAAPESAAPVRTEKVTDLYGWWRMLHCSGDWAHMYGYYWDCCAELREEGDSLRLQLWDEDISRHIGLASARLHERDGAMTCAAGAFLDRALGPEDWLITVTTDDCGELWKIEGSYEAVGNGGFQYEIYLRPWGSRWPGTKDEKPGLYESWYLPLIGAGAEMPEEIGTKP